MQALRLLAAIGICFASFSQAEGPVLDYGEPILVQFPGASISRTEFEVNYQAWIDFQPALNQQPQQDYRKFLSLLIQLKQLALVADGNGMSRESNFSLKLSRFLETAHETGLLDRDIENWKLHEAYFRQQYIVNASHILVTQAANAESEQSALRKIRRFREHLLARDAIFSDLAIRESDDPSALKNNGRLGYFTVFDQIYPLETAAYRMPIGKVSDPVKSRFGYHLIKVTGRHKVNGLKHASQIFIKHPSSDKPEMELAKLKIDRIYSRLNSSNFAELATTYSEDYKTSSKGGDLGTDRLIDPVETVKLELPVGAYSTPFETPLGWHIVKVTAIQPFQSFLQMRPLLRQKIKLDSRVAREIDSIFQVAETGASDSAVFNTYFEDLLCRLLLLRSTHTSLPKSGARVDLINYLMNTDLPRNLLDMMKNYPAKIDQNVLRSIVE